jgi:hypothetical protein
MNGLVNLAKKAEHDLSARLPDAPSDRSSEIAILYKSISNCCRICM